MNCLTLYPTETTSEILILPLNYISDPNLLNLGVFTHNWLDFTLQYSSPLPDGGSSAMHGKGNAESPFDDVAMNTSP
ncbi:hypothetical protein RRG08_050533 [Elysia crispata]|uniref:Uncharacterized protein n=1 Tax=Elysia crispata TaxID=231223 RepID=A0AAE0ZUQ5_9GAST|nr:hypothetical protein RRG08_050533 [Elysia crispata]